MPEDAPTPDVDPLDAVPAAEVAALPEVIGMPSATEWGLIERQVDTISRSALIPTKLRGKPGDLMVIVLTGRELQIPPMMALNKIHVIEGKPSLSAELMLALVLRAGHEIKVVEQTAERATVECRRRGDRGEPAHFSFSWDEAMRAGLPDSKLEWRGPEGNKRREPETGVWWNYPKAMLTARAVSAACRATFPDVLMGASYVPEELGADVDPLTGEVTGITLDLISEGEARDFYARIDALPEHLRGQLVDIMREQALVLGGRRPNGEVVPLLPRGRVDDLDAALAGLEQWVKPEPGTAIVDPQAAVEGEVVEADPEAPEPAGIVDAEVVETHIDGTGHRVADVPGPDSIPEPEGTRADGVLRADLPPSERDSTEPPRPEPAGPETPDEAHEPVNEPDVAPDPDAELRAFLTRAADEMTNAEVRADLAEHGWACPRAVEKIRPALIGFALAHAKTAAEA